MFSAEMSVSLIYLCSGRRVPGKQRAQHVWESLSNPEHSRRHSPAQWPLSCGAAGKGAGGFFGDLKPPHAVSCANRRDMRKVTRGSRSSSRLCYSLVT